MGKRVGFSLTEIKEMLDLYDLKDGQNTQMKVALKKFNEQIGVLESQRNDIVSALDELKQSVVSIQSMIKQKDSVSN
jgi:DNA-binding transcriptional MerR regulator